MYECVAIVKHLTIRIFEYTLQDSNATTDTKIIFLNIEKNTTNDKVNNKLLIV